MPGRTFVSFPPSLEQREGAERRMAHLATCSPCEGEPAALAIGPPRQPALHRGVLPVPGRSSEPDGCSRTLIRARYYARPSVRSVKPRLSAPWQRPSRTADGPPGTPATPGVRNPEIALVTAPGSATRRLMTAPSTSRDGCYVIDDAK